MTRPESLKVIRDIKLTDSEYDQINASLGREFNDSLAPRDQLGNKLFFLLKKGDVIVAQGALMNVEPVVFNGERFSLLGMVNVIANEKGMRYGIQVVTTMREYVIRKGVSCIGCCRPELADFYIKCGFIVNAESLQRFVYKKDGQSIRNQDGQVIFYLDGQDQFMRKVLSDPGKEVSVPTQRLWS